MDTIHRCSRHRAVLSVVDVARLCSLSRIGLALVLTHHSILNRTTFDHREFVAKPSRIALPAFGTGVMNVLTAIIIAQRKKPMKHFTIDNENNITVHANRQAARDTGAGVFSTEVQFADLIGPDNKRLLEIWNSLPGVKPVTKFANRKAATERIWKAIRNFGGPVAPAPELASAEIAIPEPVAQSPQPETPPEGPAPSVVNEPSIPLADQQPEPAAASQVQEPSEALVDAQHATPFDDEPSVESQATSQPETAQEPEKQPDAATPTPEPEGVATAGAQGADVATTATPATKKASRAKKTSTDAQNAKSPRENSKTAQVIAMLRREGGVTLEEIMSEMGWLKHTTRAMLSAGGSLTKKHGLIVTSEKIGEKRMYSIKA